MNGWRNEASFLEGSSWASRLAVTNTHPVYGFTLFLCSCSATALIFLFLFLLWPTYFRLGILPFLNLKWLGFRWVRGWMMAGLQWATVLASWGGLLLGCSHPNGPHCSLHLNSLALMTGHLMMIPSVGWKLADCAVLPCSQKVVAQADVGRALPYTLYNELEGTRDPVFNSWSAVSLHDHLATCRIMYFLLPGP